MDLKKIVGVIFLSFFVLIFASCSLFQGQDKVSNMGEAIDKVVQEVLPNEVPEGAIYLCVRMNNSIPEGSVIMEDSLDDNPQTFTVDEESFFFLLDLSPRTYFAHPVKFIWVGKSGDTQVIEASWWPRINNEIPEEFQTSLPDPGLIVDGNVDLTPATGNLMEFDFNSVKTQYNEGFIVVKGLMPGERHYVDSDATFFNGRDFFRSYAISPSDVVELCDNTVDCDNYADTLLTEIDNMVSGGKNLITIYIVAHGQVDSVSLGGVVHSVMQFRNKLAAHPGILFNLMLSFCYSGSFIDNLQTLPNVRVIGTAANDSEGGRPDLDNWGAESDINREDTGTEWTSSVLQAASEIVGSHAKWVKILSRASDHNVPVTCIMLYAAMRGALGLDPGLGLTQNYEFANVVGLTHPQMYRSW